jgi:hypothetical protein
MAMFKNLGEKVVVTRGHLLLWRALTAIFAGNSIIFAGMRFDAWPGMLMLAFGATFNAIGLAMLLASFRHASVKPESPI